MSQNPLFHRWGTQDANGYFGGTSTARGKSPRKTTHLFEDDMEMEVPEPSQNMQQTPELKVPMQYAASPLAAAASKSVNTTRFDMSNVSFAAPMGNDNLSDRLKRSFAASPIKARQNLNIKLESIDASEEEEETTASSAHDSSSNKSFEQSSQQSLQVEEYTRFVGVSDTSSGNNSFDSDSEYAQTISTTTDESAFSITGDGIAISLGSSKIRPVRPSRNVMGARDVNAPAKLLFGLPDKGKTDAHNDDAVIGKENAFLDTAQDDAADEDLSDAAIAEQLENDCRFQTPPVTPKKTTKTLKSPQKQTKIPLTAKPVDEIFWDQDATDEWNEKHSPRKAIRSTERVDIQSSPRKVKNATFESKKHEIAQSFLQELDELITDGKINELAMPTGGVKIVWTKTLNTTAGRANWRRKTAKKEATEGDEPAEYQHFASIELAEKVIDDEEKLLNVIAHEFCHLANFMVNGITNNPHGKEFKSWATKCSRKFGDRGIKVTTKHSYDIDYKYIWQCAECKSEYKRHSKSINPEKHRCGGCKNRLVQIRPVPRTKSKPSAYQLFIKDQMKLLKAENPGVAQKEILKMAAERWAKKREEEAAEEEKSLDDVVGQLGDLKLEPSIVVS